MNPPTTRVLESDMIIKEVVTLVQELVAEHKDNPDAIIEAVNTLAESNYHQLLGKLNDLLTSMDILPEAMPTLEDVNYSHLNTLPLAHANLVNIALTSAAVDVLANLNKDASTIMLTAQLSTDDLTQAELYAQLSETRANIALCVEKLSQLGKLNEDVLAGKEDAMLALESLYKVIACQASSL